ncbi:MAG: hypothetical protein PUK02_13240 [Parabacteroides sp.]|uniref:Uncharacterized protein n=1 Tax=Parabacteroides faecalis TaxID=2924040 RepID=A0ABT0BZS7_9BACT|nr:hypothetical protein [Parabacteroides faecalis]MCI7285277.1 hypothetical protein [Parabacteroides sp.]MDY6255010.1 hypothetical protein [Bacteroidales bacterium]MCJ2380273.1 hypothetical protein [Parabacteroides faecalis]MDD6950935.1 hypothetical protein [Parabacteroides sp.]MDD7562730.1 hypothetical protein [Parabacteroides sp.]
MKPLILSFFAIILIYSLFFDQDEKRERDYQFGLDSSMNLDKEALGQYPTDSISFLASSNKERAMSVE